MLIARCSTADLAAAQKLEDAGGRLMDTLVYFARALANGGAPDNTCNVAIRPLRKAKPMGAFDGCGDVQGLLRALPCGPAARSREVRRGLPVVAYRSCVDRDVAGEVMVADDGAIAGFATLRMNDPDEGEGVLFVSRRARRGPASIGASWWRV